MKNLCIKKIGEFYKVTKFSTKENHFNKSKKLDRDYKDESLKRSKRVIIEKVLSNLDKFNYFCTLTFDISKIDRYDLSLVKTKLLNWFNYFKKNYDNDFCYLIVPELHKDNAIHFHGFLHLDSKFTTLFRDNMYNWTNYSTKFGFNSLVKITDKSEKIAFYISKYVTKSSMSLFGKSYFCSCNLRLAPKVITSDLSLFKKCVELKIPLIQYDYCTIINQVSSFIVESTCPREFSILQLMSESPDIFKFIN